MVDHDDILLTLFVACYNEEGNIIGTLETVAAAMGELQLTHEVIVIDDASTDNSVCLISDYIQSHPNLPIRLKVNERNRGLAYNFVEGAFLGTGKYYRLICGDNVEPKETLVTIFRHLGDAEMIIPYQVVSEGRTFFRKFLSRIYTAIVNTINGHSLRYYNGLAVHLRYNVMRFHSISTGFSFQADLISTLMDEGYSYIEIPVIARDRVSGTSTALSVKNILSVGHCLLEMALRRLRRVLYGR